MSMAKSLITIGFALGLTVSCVETTTVLNPNHCANNEGDAYCAEKYPDGDLPYCLDGTNECDPGPYDEDVDGCVADLPEEACHNRCGDQNPDCDGVASATASTTGTDSMTGDPTPGTMTDSGTQGPGSETSDPTTDTETTDPTTDTSTDTGGCSTDDQCPTETPFCEGGQCVTCDQSLDPDGTCATADPALPVCSPEGTCVQCTEDSTAACDGATPVCGADNTCRGCQWHAECPDSACHLDGPDVGTCFNAGDVEEVANIGALNTAIGAIGSDDDVVLVLTGSNYDFTGLAEINDNNAEVAILGDGTTTLGTSSTTAIVSVGGTAIVYFSGVILGPDNATGVSCNGTSVWLDDTQVTGNTQAGLDISSGCAAHLRRSTVSGNDAGGIRVDNASLFMQNSAVVLNANIGPIPALDLDNATIEATFSTIAGNFSSSGPDSIVCVSASGEVRNSIVTGVDASSVSGCDTLTFENNATDTALDGTNDNVGAYTETWFQNVGTNNFRLSATGETTFMDIAMWAEGDPLFDVDGDPIPTDMPSFPGYDQP